MKNSKFKMQQTYIGHLAIFAVNLIFGINTPIPIDRHNIDINAIKTSLKLLKEEIV